MKKWLLIAASTFILYSCQKDNGTTNPVNDNAEKTMLDVSYGSDAAQKMDIYLPANRSTTSTKVIVMIHGGGWTQGDKADFTPYVDTLKRRLPGYAIINLNYRLANGSTNFFPAQENDVKAAMDFIFGKRAEYKIGDKWVFLGASAGAHLALLQAYKYTSPIIPKAVVDFYGPTDMADMYNNPVNPLVPALMMEVTGGTPTTMATLYSQSSPINYVTAQCMPTIILHGGADIVVSYNQSVMLKNKLTTFGVVNQYVFYPTENHGWVGANLVDSFDKITAFLNANVN